MSTRGIWKMTAAANNVEAWKDWHELAADAQARGHGDLVRKHEPPEGAGCHKVDKAIGRLRAAIKETGDCRMDRKQAELLVRRLTDAAYDSGYYSGLKQDGDAHHRAMVEKREQLRRQVVAALCGEETEEG